MPTFRFALVLAVLVPGAGAAEDSVHMPPLGFRYTTQSDTNYTSASSSNSNSKFHTVLHREVVASDGATIETRNEGTVSDSGHESAISGKTTYRLFLPTSVESTTRLVPEQPPVTTNQTWDCPADGLDPFYPRGTVAEVSLTCKFAENLGGRVMGPEPATVSFSDLGPARDTTPAGTFDVRKIAVRYGAPGGITSELTYDFAPTLGISVVQETKVSAPHGDTVTHLEVTEFAPAR